MSFIEKARIALLDRRARMDQELLKPVPPEKLQEFNNIIIQFKRQAPPNWQATIEACAQEVMVTKDMGALSRAILQLKTLETTNNLLAEVNHGSTATVGPERARRVQLCRNFS